MFFNICPAFIFLSLYIAKPLLTMPVRYKKIGIGTKKPTVKKPKKLNTFFSFG